MDQSNLNRASMLNGQLFQLAQGISVLDSGARIDGITLRSNAEIVPGRPVATVIIDTSYMTHPPQMLDYIKMAMTERQNAVIAELRELGVTAEAPGPPGPPAVPRIISRRQFFQASARKDMITQAEALDAVRHGEIPAVMQQGLDTLPPDEKFAAEMLLSGAGEFERKHPLVEKFAEVMHMPPAALDDIWRYAATL